MGYAPDDFSSALRGPLGERLGVARPEGAGQVSGGEHRRDGHFRRGIPGSVEAAHLVEPGFLGRLTGEAEPAIPVRRKAAIEKSVEGGLVEGSEWTPGGEVALCLLPAAETVPAPAGGVRHRVGLLASASTGRRCRGWEEHRLESPDAGEQLRSAGGGNHYAGCPGAVAGGEGSATDAETFQHDDDVVAEDGPVEALSPRTGRCTMGPAVERDATEVGGKQLGHRSPGSSAVTGCMSEQQERTGPAQLVDGQPHPVGGLHAQVGIGRHGRNLSSAGVNGGGCVLPTRKQWGWAAQLYSLRRRGDAGIGDLESLRLLSQWSAGVGASFVLVSPLHALAPGQDSPYYPTTRCFRDPTCLPGGAEVEFGPVIDRASARASKLAERLAAFRGLSTTGRLYLDEMGQLLRGFAAFSVAAAELGWDHRLWPEDLRDDPRRATELIWREEPDRAAFVVEVQADIERHLAGVAATGCPPVNDIAVGVDPGGFDAWWWQEGLLPGVSVGAPPDEFNADGQDWGVAAFDPDWLSAVERGPVDMAWEMAARHAVGLRIDHVMGLSRQWLVPAGVGPLEGAYERFPLEPLLERLTSLSRSTDTWIVGEDLGTVEDGLRPRLQSSGVLSMKVMRFEHDPPSEWPERALAMASTHDLPPLGHSAVSAHGELAASPCIAVAPTLEDALGVSEPPNRPGVDHPLNWRQSLPSVVEELTMGEDLAPTVRAMGLRSTG